MKFEARLLAAFAVVILVAVGSVAVFVKHGAGQEISEYEELSRQLEMTRMEHWLLGYYTARGGWAGVQPFVEEMAVLQGRTIVVTDPRGKVVAESLTGPEWPERETPIVRGERVVGTLHVSTEPTIDAAYTQALEASVNLFLLWGSIIAGLVALGLTAILSRRISAPVRALAAFAEKAGSGVLSARVELRDRGELGALGRAFNRMATELEQAAARHRSLIADTAHELRTPLTNIIGYLEAAQDGLVDTDTAIGSVTEEADLLSRLVADLHELALAEAGSLQLVKEPQDIGVLIERSVAASRAVAREHGVAIEIDVPNTMPAVSVDSQRICQVLHNLLQNAIRYSAGERIVRVGARPVAEAPGAGAPAAAAAAQWVEVSVCDSGMGIAPIDLPLVFERYYRADRSRSRASGGSGLGLSIAKQLVEAHGGTISADSPPDGGSRFSFRLPV